jgi:hypothetical protein
LAISFFADVIQFRRKAVGSDNPWQTLWHTGNLTQNLTSGYLPYWNGSSLDRNQVTVEFPTLYKVDKDGERTQAISITVDYFNDMIRIFHNDEEMLLEIPWDESKQVMVVPSVKKLINERGV